MNLKELVIDVPDFPSPGILFRDISPVLKNPDALHQLAENFRPLIDRPEVELVAGIEARGFIIGMLLATYFNRGFLPLRKAGKLPPPTISASYSLEYGEAAIETKAGSGNLVIIDDVLATGGTLQAAVNLCKKAGYEVLDLGVFINLTYLNTMEFKGKEIFSVIKY